MLLYQYWSRNHHCRWSWRRLSRHVHDLVRNIRIAGSNPGWNHHRDKIHHHCVSIPRFLQSIHYWYTLCGVFCDGCCTRLCVNCVWFVWLYGTSSWWWKPFHTLCLVVYLSCSLEHVVSLSFVITMPSSCFLQLCVASYLHPFTLFRCLIRFD